MSALLLTELNEFRAWAEKPPLKAWHSKRSMPELELYREIKARETATNAEHAAAAAKLVAEAEAMNAKTAARAAKLAEANKAAIAEADKRENTPTPAVAKPANGGKVMMPEANGIRRPKADTVCGSIWAFLDSKGFSVVIADAIAFGNANGINEYTIRTQTSRWRKFNGVKM